MQDRFVPMSIILLRYDNVPIKGRVGKCSQSTLRGLGVCYPRNFDSLRVFLMLSGGSFWTDLTSRYFYSSTLLQIPRTIYVAVVL